MIIHRPLLPATLAFFRLVLKRVPESLQQTIAHEMFHCYQFKNLREQTLIYQMEIKTGGKKGQPSSSAPLFIPLIMTNSSSIVISELLFLTKHFLGCPTRIIFSSNTWLVKAV